MAWETSGGEDNFEIIGGVLSDPVKGGFLKRSAEHRRRASGAGRAPDLIKNPNTHRRTQNTQETHRWGDVECRKLKKPRQNEVIWDGEVVTKMTEGDRS